MKRITISVTDSILEKIERIKEKRDIRTFVDALWYCVCETYEQQFENYKEVLKNRPPRVVLSSFDKALKDMDDQKEKQKAKLDLINHKGRALCQRLDGIEIDNKNGTFGCEYQLFEKFGTRVMKGKRTVPYDMLGEDHAAVQYKGGTKEEIDLLVKEELSKANATVPTPTQVVKD